MAIAETAKLVSSLELDTRKFDQGIGKANKGLKTLSVRTIAAGSAIGVGLERVAEKGLSALGGAIGDGIQGVLTLEKAMGQTQAVIQSTGGAAHVSATQVRDLANSLEDVTTVDDKTIQQAENLLLTFTSIGGSIFPAATKAATDMAIAFNKGDAATADLDGAAIQLGKALNDPAAGFAALKKSGVSFSDAQIKILKGTNALTKEQNKHYQALLKTDKGAAKRYSDGIKAANLLKSQKLILAELDKEFGKAGEAAGTGFAADISRANDAIDDAKISIAQGLMPALGEVARELSKTFKDPAVIQGLKDFGVAIGNVIKGGVAFAKTVPWGAIASSLQTAAGFAKDLLGAFLGLPTWVQTAVITGWGLNKLTGGALTDIFSSLAGGLIKGVLGMTAGVVNINAATVTGVGGVPGAGAAGAAGTGILGLIGPAAIAAIVATVVTQVANEDLHKTFPTATFAVPGSSGSNPLFAVLPFGIGASLENIATAVGIISGNTDRLPSDPVTGQDIEKLRGTIPFKPGPGTGTDNTRPHGTGSNQGNMEAHRAEIGDRLTKAELAAGVKSGVSTMAGDIESLRGAILADLQLPAKTAAQANAILATSAQHDAETSSSIATLVAQSATSGDIETLRGNIAQGLSGLDTSTVTAGHNTSIAATQAGFHAAQQTFSSGLGIEGAIARNRPIINVDVSISATTINRVKVVEDRGGSRDGSRDGDGGGGPGQ